MFFKIEVDNKEKQINGSQGLSKGQEGSGRGYKNEAGESLWR